MTMVTAQPVKLVDPSAFAPPSDEWWHRQGTFPGSPDTLIGSALASYFQFVQRLEQFDNEQRDWWSAYYLKSDAVYDRHGKLRSALTPGGKLDPDKLLDQSWNERWLEKIQPEVERLTTQRKEHADRAIDALEEVTRLLWGRRGIDRLARAYPLPGVVPLTYTWPYVAEPSFQRGQVRQLQALLDSTPVTFLLVGGGTGCLGL
jgi:hypothetical protein